MLTNGVTYDYVMNHLGTVSQAKIEEGRAFTGYRDAHIPKLPLSARHPWISVCYRRNTAAGILVDTVFMIPDLVDGHLPPGRFRCSVPELEARFVAHTDFDASSTRVSLFQGFLRYLAMWQLLEERSGLPPSTLLRYVWVAGSFASIRLDPTDIDITPVVDGDVADSVRKRGIKKLIGDRTSIKAKYGVEVFPITWVPVVSALSAEGRSAQEAAYISDRGKLDDFWQRRRSNEAIKAPPTVEECATRRGYLEVIV